MKRKRKTKKSTAKLRTRVRNGSLSFASLMITGLIVLGMLYLYVAVNLPNVNQLRDAHLQEPLRVYTLDGKLIAIFGEKKRIPVTIDKIPQQLINAFIDTEDQRFYEHHGVDFIGLARAAINLVTTGRKTQGASTITMQVARNFFLSRHKTYGRKLNEIILALRMEQVLSKQDILELYLNKIYLGQRTYGVAAAARVYFGKKDLNQLTLPEMAILGGLPQAPSRDNPITNPEAAKERRDHVLGRMLENNHIDRASYQEAIAAPVVSLYHPMDAAEVYAPYVAEMVRRAMVQQFGDDAYEQGFKVYTTIDSNLQNGANQAITSGLLAYDKRHGYRGSETNFDGNYSDDGDKWLKDLRKMPTYNSLEPAVVVGIQAQSLTALRKDGSLITIDWNGMSWARPQLQEIYLGAAPQKASDIVHIGDVIRTIEDRNANWQLRQTPQVEGSLVALNPKNGAITALTGGFSYIKSKFNRAIAADRQPGSSFKPFVYSAALNKGFTLASLFNDAPIVMSDTGANELWRPQNDTRTFYGPTRLRVALMKSRNLVSIRVLRATGILYAIDYLERFGFNKDQLPHSLSLALGSATISPIELATGYATFANGGFKINPYFISRIENQTGKAIFQAHHKEAPKPNSEEFNSAPLIAPDDLTNYNQYSDKIYAPRVITAQNAYLMYNAMQDVIKRGTGRGALVLHRPDLAGKTGTTNKKNDAWFSGYNSDLVATVWVGFDHLKSLREYGARAALPIWIDFMRSALSGQPLNALPQPNGIVATRIDPKSGLLASPTQENSIYEIFADGTVPTATEARDPTDELSSDASDSPEESSPFSANDTNVTHDNENQPTPSDHAPIIDHSTQDGDSEPLF